jgi:hypothetical protein
MSDQTKAVVSAGTVDGSFDHTWHLGKLNWFLYWLLWNKFANFFLFDVIVRQFCSQRDLDFWVIARILLSAASSRLHLTLLLSSVSS